MAEADRDMVELVRYPSKSEVDMLIPHLEAGGVRGLVQDIRGMEVEDPPFASTTSPEGAYRIMVCQNDLEEAREICRDFEDEREEMFQQHKPEWEPQDIESPDEAEA